MKTMKAAVAALATLGLAAFGLAGCGEKADYTVGVVQLAQHPALDAATKGFQDKLTELVKADGKTIKIDVKNAGGDSSTASTIANGFVSNNVDLIMANATPALQAAAQATDTIPVLATSITDYASALEIENWSGTTGINVSGTSDLAPLNEQAAMIKELLPDAQTIGIIYCSNEANSVYQAEAMKKNLEELGYTVEFFTFADANDVQAVAQNAVEKVDALYLPTDNEIATKASIIDEVASAAKVPVIAGEEGICTGAGLATLSIDYYDLGVKTAEMAYEILVKGAKPGDMEVQFADATTKKYVPARAEALGITIPDGYEAIVEEEK